MPVARFQIILFALVACKAPPREEAPPVDDFKQMLHDPVVLADHQPGPSGVVVDATHVYWTHVGKPLVRRMPRAGGAVETLYEGTGELGGQWLALDADGVYFSEAFTIQHVAKTGGTPQVVGTVGQLPARFAADNDAAYSASGAVMRHPRAGGDWRVSGGSELWDVAVDATHVYWLDRDGVFRVSKTGGEQQQLARGVFRWAKLALSDTDVYWGDAVLESIFAVQKAGGKPRFVAHGWSLATRGMIVDGARLWVMQSGGNLKVIDLNTRDTISIASGLARGGSADNFYGFAVTPDAVFVAAGGQSLVGTGPVHIDLTQPNPQFPTYTYDGAILELPATLPAKPMRTPAGELTIARTYFQGVTTEFQDPGNATRWIDQISEAYDIKGGTIGVRLIAGMHGISEQIARERASKVEALIRDKLGPAARITIAIDTAASHNDVGIGFDEADLLGYFANR